MNKRGSYIAEAAIVLPFIILAVITCVLIVMDFYESVSQQCEEHRVERAGEVTEAALEDADEELLSAPKAKIAGVSYVRKYQVAQRLTNTDDNDIDNNNDNNDNNDNLEE